MIIVFPEADDGRATKTSPSSRREFLVEVEKKSRQKPNAVCCTLVLLLNGPSYKRNTRVTLFMSFQVVQIVIF